MKRLLIILFLLIASPCFSADIIEKEVIKEVATKKYYVFIDKRGHNNTNDVIQNEKGDVIAISPYVEGKMPVEYYNNSFIVKVASLTEENVKEMLSVDTTEPIDSKLPLVTSRARKVKVNVETLYTKDTLLQQELYENIIIKSSVISDTTK